MNEEIKISSIEGVLGSFILFSISLYMFLSLHTKSKNIDESKSKKIIHTVKTYYHDGEILSVKKIMFDANYTTIYGYTNNKKTDIEYYYKNEKLQFKSYFYKKKLNRIIFYTNNKLSKMIIIKKDIRKKSSIKELNDFIKMEEESELNEC